MRKQPSSAFWKHAAVIAVAVVVSVLLLGLGVFLLTHLSLFGTFIALLGLAALWALVRFLPAARTLRLRRSDATFDPKVPSLRERLERGTNDHPTLR